MKQTTMTWNPARELEDIRGRLFGFLGKQRPQMDWGVPSYSDWEPAVDVAEDEKEYTLTADIPDVRKEDLHVSLQGDSIELSGERKRGQPEKGKTYHRSEREFGKFTRSFYLPENVSSDAARAEFREGTLTVHIPKTETSAPAIREIPIG